jgi:pimeloyl-[acyl-carrier protein] methyl ester esterase
MSMLALSGWGQPHDALATIAPDALHFNYARYASVEEALAALADTAQGYKYAMGWSLGGQLLARAISAGMIAPKKLLLIAPPYQFVEQNRAGPGMKRDTIEKFFDNFLHHPLRTLHKAWALVHHDDSHAALIANQMAVFSKDAVLAGQWLNWLSLIEGFSCEALDYSRFPPTLLVHGERDAVVEPAQSQRFAERIAQARVVLWPGCGHAPHWHNPQAFTQLMTEHFRAG